MSTGIVAVDDRAGNLKSHLSCCLFSLAYVRQNPVFSFLSYYRNGLNCTVIVNFPVDSELFYQHFVLYLQCIMRGLSSTRTFSVGHGAKLPHQIYAHSPSEVLLCGRKENHFLDLCFFPTLVSFIFSHIYGADCDCLIIQSIFISFFFLLKSHCPHSPYGLLVPLSFPCIRLFTVGQFISVTTPTHFPLEYQCIALSAPCPHVCFSS